MSDFCQMTRDNHFKFGYDDTFFVDRVRGDQKFSVTYGQCKSPIFDWRYHCTKSAEEISVTYKDKPIYVCLSGGIDSEVVVRSF